MNNRSDIDRVLNVWMADGPAAIPDRVVDVVANRIGVQRQQRTWRLQGRPFMNTYAKLAAAAAAVLVVGVVGWQLLPGNGGIGGQQTPAPTASAQPSAPLTAPPSPSATHVFPTTGILTPGSHTTKQFTPAFTFSVPEVWINDGDTAGGPGDIAFYSLFPDTPANRAEWARTGNAAQGILIAKLSSPYYFCDAWEENSGATAAEIVAKVTANEAISTTGLVDVEIGGLTGKQFDIRLNPDWTETCPGDPPGTDLSDQRNRQILLDVPGGGVLVTFIGTPHAADFEAHLAQAMPVVQSFEFDLGQ